MSSGSAPPPHEPVTRIRPAATWAPLRFGELREYRELLTFLVWRNLKVRYRQTALGAAWAVLQPTLAMVVFSVFFGRFAGIPSEGAPYPIFAFAGLVPWTYFANALAQASNSLVEHERMITKVYFPRVLLPASAVGANLVDLAIASLVLLAMMVYGGIPPSPALLAAPLFVALAAATALAVGLWLAVLNVRYRDVRYVVPFLVQIWLLATPVAYPASLVPEAWRPLYGLNPMAGVVEGFRWALLGSAAAPGPIVAVSAATVAALLVGGFTWFRRMEQEFADVI